MTDYDRLIKMIRKTDDCWIWLGKPANHGYGLATLRKKQTTAHRAVYLLLVGEIPEGHDLDHLCRNRICVNPQHLEPVTKGENLKRSPLTVTSINKAKTHCPQGHEYNNDNTRYDLSNKNRTPTRKCKKCVYAYKTAWRNKRRAEGRSYT